MKAIHFLLVVSTALAAGLPVTVASGAFPPGANKYLLMAAAACVLVAGVAGALSTDIRDGRNGVRAATPNAPAVTDAKVPPGLSVMMVFVSGVFFVALMKLFVACTPAQAQSITKTVADVSACINAEAVKQPPETPEQMAVACGLEAAPDIFTVVSTLAEKRRHPTPSGPCTTVTVAGFDAGAAVGK